MKQSDKTTLNNAIVHIGLFYFFYFSVVGIYIIFLPKLLLSDGLSAAQVGVIYGAGPFMRFLLPFAFWHLFHLTHSLFRFALILGVISVLLMWFWVGNFWLYLIANLLFGASAGAILPFVDTIALQTISKELYGKARLWGSIGFMIVALVLGVHLGNIHHGIFALGIAVMATMIAGYNIVKYDFEKQSNKNPREQNRDFSLLRYWAFWLSAFLLQVSFGGFYNFFTIYETANGVSLQTAGYLWSFGVLCEIIIFYFQGSLLRENLLTLLKLATATAILRWSLLYIFPHSLLAAYVSQSMHAFSFALYYTAIISYVYRLYKQKKLAQQFLLGLSYGLGGSLGAVIAGWIYDFDSNLLFGFEAFIAFLSLIFIYVHQKRREYTYVQDS